MIPLKRFDGWIDWKDLGVCINLNLRFGRFWIQVGPLNGQVNFNV